jgi:hypothetical protein
LLTDQLLAKCKYIIAFKWFHSNDLPHYESICPDTFIGTHTKVHVCVINVYLHESPIKTNKNYPKSSHMNEAIIFVKVIIIKCMLLL